ncbi:PD-(D/E)XK nuclease family protein [Actinosynnema sp. NPDC050436]|uniref:PD-(D/E)XK nuclease family protein n=1 Tax=Actinosynnema sp. NPDC050436 TaxID=3155659 RepID=UPI0033CFDEF0
MSRSVHAVLDLVEFEQVDAAVAIQRWRDREAPHPGVERWVTHAVTNVLSSEAGIEDLPTGLVPVSRWWARQRPAKPDGSGTYEETVHGRRYENDYGVREIRLLRLLSVDQREADAREVAFAAGVVAGASRVLSNPWAGTEYRLGRFEAPKWIRVVEVGCDDGSARVLFSGTREDALERYNTVVAGSLSAVAVGGEYRPGDDCGGCALVDNCPAVPSLPGLLGVLSDATPRRTWSVTTGRNHLACAARAHFGRLFLPGDKAFEDTDATRRGRAVHHWIEQRHRVTPPRPCRASDVPGPAEAWESGGWRVEGKQAGLGIQMIGDHSLTCPLRGLPTGTQVLPEESIVVFDPQTNVVVVAKADLLYRGIEGWTLRETKTQRYPGQGDMFDDYPQLALATVLSARGVRAVGEVKLRVELERLTGAGPVLTEVDTSDPAVLARAEKVLLELVGDWLTDREHPTNPGEACRDCPYTRWCPDARRGRP